MYIHGSSVKRESSKCTMNVAVEARSVIVEMSRFPDQPGVSRLRYLAASAYEFH